MRYIKKFNESFDSDNEIDKFLIEIKDDCAEISDKFTVFIIGKHIQIWMII